MMVGCRVLHRFCSPPTQKLQCKQLDLICANRVGVGATGFESDDNTLLVLGHEGFEQTLGPAAKTEIAGQLLDLVAERVR